MKRSGTADLPLHGGRVPPWLAERMTQLGTAIPECVIEQYDPSEFLTRLSDPFWFQSLGCVLGIDFPPNRVRHPKGIPSFDRNLKPAALPAKTAVRTVLKIGQEEYLRAER